MQTTCGYMRTGLRMVCVLLLAVCFLLSTGCRKTPDEPPQTEPAHQTVTKTEPTQETAPVQETESVQETEPSVVCTVDDIRQAMEGTSQTIAAAYFGYAHAEDLPQLFVYLESSAPMLCQTMPFLLEIPQENVIGEYCGEVYCIVPADPAASVTVNRAVMDENGGYEYTEMLFSSESGEPILLICNDSGIEPDTQVIITDSVGTETVWYPQRNDNYILNPLWNDIGDVMIWDVTSYVEELTADYAEIQTWGWTLPTEEDLIGKTWGCERTLSDGRWETCLISFGENTAYVRWNEGNDEDDHEYLDAEWELSHVNGFAVLSLDFGEFAGTLRYDLLYDAEYGQLYAMMDASTGKVEPGYEPLFRYLESRSMDAPDPMGMVGTWERFQWEVEDYREEDTTGLHTLIITGETEHDLTISMADKERPDSSYQNKPLNVMQGVIYTDCGNSLWMAEVDHVGLWGTTYTVTLLEDGTLLLRSYWIMDEAPMVSYAWYRLT